jgi:hypothetical protein
MSQKEFTIRRGITDNHPRQLIIDEDFLQFENNNTVNNQFIRFDKSEIASYCFGINWMRYKFVFGREYVISIRNFEGQVIKINFKTYFGRKKDEYHTLCNEILSVLWDNYFGFLVQSFIDKHKAGEEFTIGEVLFVAEGIVFTTNSSLKLKKALIPWDKVGTKNYSTYFAIYAIDDAATTNRGYSYLKDWNTAVLKQVLEVLLELK